MKLTFWILALSLCAAVDAANPPKAEWEAWLAKERKEAAEAPDSLFRTLDSVRLGLNETAYADLKARKWRRDGNPSSRPRATFTGKALRVELETDPEKLLNAGESWNSPAGISINAGGIRPDYVYAFLFDSRKSRYQEALMPFFQFNPEALVRAKFVRSTENKKVKFTTTEKNQREVLLFGEATFSYQGRDHTLAIYAYRDNPKTLFLPFRDQTNGKSTYEGGRYLDAAWDGSRPDELTIDFNRAYNPYCAYSHLYDCPIVTGNKLEVPMAAGAKRPPKKLD